MQQITEVQDQLEQSRVELETFEILRKNEVDAIPKRIQVCNSCHVTTNGGQMCYVYKTRHVPTQYKVFENLLLNARS